MSIFVKTKRKHALFLILSVFLFGSALLVVPQLAGVQSVHAAAQATADQKGSGGLWSDLTGWWNDLSINPIKWLLYGFVVVLAWLAQAATAILVWAIDPNYISGPDGVLNSTVIYTLWKFIRDFFNLFFILVLLYTAFTIIFQVASNYKQALLKLVLMALLVNFSFPISRFIIDTANVPMYFFAQQAFGGGTASAGTAFSGTILNATKLKEILVPQHLGNTSSEQLLAAVIFLFLFSMSLLVQSVMLVIRLVALIILVIFSSVGFATSIIPGLSTYSKQWWDNLLKYAFFGPATMLMMLISVRFMQAKVTEETYVHMNQAVFSMTPTAQSSEIASMAMFAVPLVLIWFSIGLANKFSIAGAGTVTSHAKSWGKWVAKKMTYDNPVSRGIGGGLKEKTGMNAVQRWWKGPSRLEAAFKGGIIGSGTGNVFKRRGEGAAKGWSRTGVSAHNKAVAARMKEMEEEGKGDDELREIVRNPSVHRKEDVEAAVKILSKKDLITDEAEMDAAIKAIEHVNGEAANSKASQEKISELIKKAGGSIYTTGAGLAQAIEHLGDDSKAVASLVDKAGSKALNDIDLAKYQGLNAKSQGILGGKMKKEGIIEVLAEDEAAKSGISYKDAIAKTMASMGNPEAVKVFASNDPATVTAAKVYLLSIRKSKPGRYAKIQAEI